MVNAKSEVSSKLKFDLTPVALPDNDTSYLTHEEVILMGARREFVTAVPLVIARRLAKEQTVHIIRPNEIRMVLTRGNLRMFVLHRDSHTCAEYVGGRLTKFKGSFQRHRAGCGHLPIYVLSVRTVSMDRVSTPNPTTYQST